MKRKMGKKAAVWLLSVSLTGMTCAGQVLAGSVPPSEKMQSRVWEYRAFSLLAEQTPEQTSEQTGEMGIQKEPYELLPSKALLQEGQEYIPVECVTLDPEQIIINSGTSMEMKAYVFPTNATFQEIKWYSDAPQVASVDADTGKVMAVSEGEARIYAYTDCREKPYTASAMVKVRPAGQGETEIPVQSVVLSKPNIYMMQGERVGLEAHVIPYNATHAQLTWSSDSAQVASVDENGYVTANAPGKATITVQTENGQMAQTKVSVSAGAEKHAPKLNCQVPAVVDTRSEDRQLHLSAEATVEGSEITHVDFAVEGEETVSVKTGPFRADITLSELHGFGGSSSCVKVTITAYAANGTSTAEDFYVVYGFYDEKVEQPSEPGRPSEGSQPSQPGEVSGPSKSDQPSETSQPSGSGQPSEGSQPGEPSQPGEVSEPGKSDQPSEVQPSVEPGIIPVEKVIINQSLVNIKKGETAKLQAKVEPENATYPGVSWSSENPEIAAVNPYTGEVFAKQEGGVWIKASSGKGDQKVTATVLVLVQAASQEETSQNPQTPSQPTEPGASASVNPPMEASTPVSPSVEPSIVPKPSAVSQPQPSTEPQPSEGSEPQPSQPSNSEEQKPSTPSKEETPTVTIKQSSVVLELKKKKKLTVNVLPAELSNRAVIFDSSRDKIVKIAAKDEKKGTVTLQAQKVGAAVLTVKLKANPSIRTQIPVLVKPAKMSKPKAGSVKKDAIQIVWSKMDGASGYELIGYDKKKKTVICKKITKTKYTVGKLKKNSTYQFKVRAYVTQNGKTTYGAYSPLVQIKTKKK